MGIIVKKRRNGGPSSLFPPNYHHRLILSLSLVVLLTAVSASRSPPDLISDGIQNRNNDVVGWSHLRLPSFLSSSLSSSDSCDETYGFMPCTTTVLGNVFLILVYGFLMYTAATYLSGGSELLLEILGPGIIGGLFLPILGALPDALLILVSGLSGDTTTAQEQVSVGMGLLAGSTVMLLTVVWGSCVLVGKCDLQDSVAIDKTDTKGRCNLFGSGVSTDIWTSYSARIMAVSVIPFIVVQLPQTLSSSSARRLAVLIGLILSVALLAAYCLYQIFQPWIQKRRLVYAKHKRVIAGFLKHLKMRALGRLLDDSGRPNEEVLMRLFRAIDSDGDGHLSSSELTAFVIGIQLDEMKNNEDEIVKKILADFDTGLDSKVSFEEFKHGITKWLSDISGANPPSGRVNPDTLKYLSDVHNETRREHDLLGANEDDEEDGENEIENTRKTTIKAVLMLILGTVIAAIFADPLVDTVDNFSDATGIPTFFISFIALPLATNASESVSAIIFASRKTRRTASLTFSELYGAATMNNVLCLSVFLALVYIRDLTWDFSSEVLIIVIVCVAIGILGSFRTAFPVWTSSIAFALYPFSLVLVYVLDYICGWS